MRAFRLWRFRWPNMSLRLGGFQICPPTSGILCNARDDAADVGSCYSSKSIYSGDSPVFETRDYIVCRRGLKGKWSRTRPDPTTPGNPGAKNGQSPATGNSSPWFCCSPRGLQTETEPDGCGTEFLFPVEALTTTQVGGRPPPSRSPERSGGGDAGAGPMIVSRSEGGDEAGTGRHSAPRSGGEARTRRTPAPGDPR